MGEKRWGWSGGTPGRLTKKPSVFPSLLSPPLQGDGVRQTQNVCVEEAKRDGRGQSDCVGSRQAGQ